MSDSIEPNDDRALAGEYALGLMPAPEAAVFTRRVSAEPRLAAMVAAWQDELATLADEVDPVTPPARVLRRIDRRLFAQTKTPGWLAAAIPGVLAATMALLLVFSPEYLPVRAPSDPVYHIDLANQQGALLLAAGYDGDRGELYVIPYLTPETGNDHELWLIEGGNAPISLGVLPERRPARIAIPAELAARLDGGVLAMSVEPDGGSPTGAPTGPVIATGEVQTL